MDRRRWLQALAATTLTATPLTAFAETKSVKLSKAFGYLDIFLKVPPQERTRFSLAYYFLRNKKPAPDIRAFVVQGANRTPLALGPDARVLRLPTLAELQSDAALELDVVPGTKVGLDLELHADIAPSNKLDAHEIDLALQQVTLAIKHRAGILGFAVPKISQANFPGAGAGVAVLADGRTTPLPKLEDGPYYDPGAMPGVKIVALARAPSRIVLDTHHG